MAPLALFLLLPFLLGARSYSLADHRIAGTSEAISLDGAWTATDGVHAIEARVPGDLITDLEINGLIDDPIFETNWKNDSLWAKGIWNYTKTISPSKLLERTNGREGEHTFVLVFDGIKMGARIYINDVLLRTADDQFLRYEIGLAFPDHTLKWNFTITVQFDPSIPVNGRFMACSGGWDWAPYSSSTTEDGTPSFSRGIWKNVYMVPVDNSAAAIYHVVPQIFYKGDYPLQKLIDGHHAGFHVDVRLHMYSPVGGSGVARVCPEWTASESDPCVSTRVSLPAGESNFTVALDASADQISLWWPVGLGGQNLYNLTVEFVPDNTTGLVTRASRRVGFRHFALVTGNDTEPGFVERNGNREGTLSHGMYFRINGVVILSKGANMIPMEEMEGRMNAEAHRILVQSAVDANMNTLRVWGGGIYLPDVWYDACDELGVIVYHDMQYAQRGHSPKNSTTQAKELAHQIRRLSSHPSIALWDGCNECTVIMNKDTGIYATFVMTVVASEDHSRAVWPSCPALGWTTGVDRLTSRPLPYSSLATPDNADGIEIHGPYEHGTGFPAVNGWGDKYDVALTVPLVLKQKETTGLRYPNVFASEFGCSVMSSFESMSATLKPEHWGMHGGEPWDTCGKGFHGECKGSNVMAERNYPCDNIIEAYFGSEAVKDINQTGVGVFQKHLYMCMLGQAMHIKGDIEARRATNTFGLLLWQLNEIWPTGGWGSLEYGNPNYKGQVTGGRWKPLHYILRRSAFADVIATCSASGLCYVKNDRHTSFAGNVLVESINIKDATAPETKLYNQNLTIAEGPGQIYWFNIKSMPDPTLNILRATVADHSTNEVLCSNTVALTPPKSLKIDSKASIEAEVVGLEGNIANLNLKTTNVGLYVVLTTLAQGRFSDNAMLLTPGVTELKFYFFGKKPDMKLLESSLRVEDLSQYMA